MTGEVKEQIPQKPIILELFDPKVLKQKNDGNFQTECPCCGLQGGRTEGFIIYPENNTWYCHSSLKHGGLLELVAMQKGIIRCGDCCETGEKRRVLEGAMFKEVMDILQAEYPEELYKNILAAKGLKQRIQLPNDGTLISDFANILAKRVKVEDIFFYRPEEKKIVEIGKTKYSDGRFEYKGFVPVESGRFVTIIERYFTPWKNVYTKWGTEQKITSMPTSVASIVMMADNFREQIPVINRIFTVPLPIIHEKKLTFPERGYDKRFASWMDFNSPKISKPDMSVEEAKELLKFIHKEFPYQDEQDRTNAIARIITPFCRGLYSRFTCRTPLFVIKANRERAGKDFHEGVTSVLYEGVAGEEPPISNNEHGSGNNNEELRKKVMSALIAGRKKMHFSNNKGFINNAVFEGIITSEHHSDRVLGSNITLSFPNEMEFSLSGNTGITMSADLLNRSRTINLFLEIEDANSRKFENPDLHGWILKNRDLILSAVYSLVRNWFEKGMNPGSLPFTSFPEWARVVGGIMEAAGYDSPCITNDDISGVAIDSETSDMKALFELCYENKPEQWMNKKEIRDLMIEKDEQIFQYLDWDKKSDQTKFGMKINKYAGRVLSDIKLVVKDRSARAARWELMFTRAMSDFGKPMTEISKTSTEISDLELKEVENVLNRPIFDEKLATMVTLASSSTLLETPIVLGELYSTRDVANVTSVTKENQEEPSKDQVLEFKEGTQEISDIPSKSIEPIVPKYGDTKTEFWLDECTQDIKASIDQSQLLEWLNLQKEATIEQLYEKFGVGCIKIKNQLLEQGKIKQEGLKIICQEK